MSGVHIVIDVQSSPDLIEVSFDKDELELKEEEPELDQEVMAFVKQSEQEIQEVYKEQENPDTDMSGSSFDSGGEQDDASNSYYDLSQDH